MINKGLILTIFSLTLLGGCQTGQSDRPSWGNSSEYTSHPSQSVYQVEFVAAQKFSDEAQALSDAFTQYCAQPDDLSLVTQQWHNTTLAWMALQGQERGPKKALERSWNVQFWPDKKNTTGRKMQNLVNSSKVYDAAEIADQSVTVQGIGAVEWLLYDQSSALSSQPQICTTAIAITENLANNAKEIKQAWESNPWKMMDKTAWQAEYLALLSNQLDYSIKKLSRPMAKIGKPRPYFAESWRSQTSMSNLEANIKAMENLYIADGKGLDHLLRSKGHTALADRIISQFDTMLTTWPSEASLFQLLQSKEGYQQVLSQYNKLTQLRYLIHEEVAIELGIVIGFNATDGD